MTKKEYDNIEDALFNLRLICYPTSTISALRPLVDYVRLIMKETDDELIRKKMNVMIDRIDESICKIDFLRSFGNDGIDILKKMKRKYDEKMYAKMYEKKRG